MSSMLANRMKREYELLQTDPPHGVGAWPAGDSLTKLEASLTGPEDTPFEGGTFRLSVEVTLRYPFEAPKIRFLTKVYHPNIDTGGRICLDTLKMPPRGTWVPSMNISTTLQHIRLLLATPNADDGLMPEITAQYKANKRLFEKTAKEWTRRHAMSSPSRGNSSSASASASASASSSTTSSTTTTTTTHKRAHDDDSTTTMTTDAVGGVEQSTRPMKKLKGHDLTNGQDTVVEEATHKEEEEEEESDEEEESEESEEEESEEEC